MGSSLKLGGAGGGEEEVGGGGWQGREKWGVEEGNGGGGEEKEIGGEMGVKKGKNDKGKWKREGGK